MYDPTKVPSFIPAATTIRKAIVKKTPIKKFWEELLPKGNVEQVLFLAPENVEGYYKSLLDGQKKSYMEFGLHKTVAIVDGKETYPDIVCTCGLDPYNKKPCVGCYQYEHFTGRPNPWKVHFTTKHQIVHFAWYHNVPRLDKDGKQVVYQDKPQFSKERCVGDSCVNCTKQYERTFGRLMKLTLGANHTKNVMGIRKSLYWTCSGCNTQIVTKELICEGCNKTLVDLRNIRGEDPKDELGSKRRKIEQAINQIYECSCGHTGTPVEGNDCGYNAACTIKSKKHKCPYEAPLRMDLYTSVLEICKKGEKTDSHISLEGAYSIFENSENAYQFEVDEQLSVIVNRAVEMNSGLYDLEKEVKEQIVDVAEQATTLNVKNPYGEGPRLPSEEDSPRKGGAESVTFRK